MYIYDKSDFSTVTQKQIDEFIAQLSLTLHHSSDK